MANVGCTVAEATWDDQGTRQMHATLRINLALSDDNYLYKWKWMGSSKGGLDLPVTAGPWWLDKTAHVLEIKAFEGQVLIRLYGIPSDFMNLVSCGKPLEIITGDYYYYSGAYRTLIHGNFWSGCV